MQYRFPIYGKGEDGPVELPGSCEALTDDGGQPAIRGVFSDGLPPGWYLHDPNNAVTPLALDGFSQAAHAVDDTVDVIVPWTSSRLPHAPGCNDTEMVWRVFACGGEPYEIPLATLWSGQVCLVRESKSVRRRMFRAPRAWVNQATDIDHPYDTVDGLARRVSKYLKPTQSQVVFVFREFPICGVTLAATHICNGLNWLGWNATIACTMLDPVQARLFPFEFGLMMFKGMDELKTMLRRRLTPGSCVVCPVHAMVDDSVDVVDSLDVELLYYVQDDERRFRRISGEPYYSTGKVEAGWSKAAKHGRLIANSKWVSGMLVEAGHKAGFVPIGVDTDTFKPGNRSKPPFKIMAHCRPSTPRRGWGFICAVFNQLAVRGLDFEAVTYDENPVGLQVLNHRHLGKLSPAEVAQEMSGAHVFIEGSDVQGFGMQALEAMASECMLLCTANKGIDTFGTNGRDCIIVRHGDVKAAADCIVYMAISLETRLRLGRNAREKAQTYDWRLVSMAWDRVLLGRSAEDVEENT